MNKQDMKSSIDYKKINMPLKCYLILLVVLMCFDIFLLIFIIYKIPYKYLFEVILAIITSKNVLIGYNKGIDSIIFIKNL